MSMQTEHHLISQLEENYKTGYELLGLIYSQRSLSRSITDGIYYLIIPFI